jgi:hypothetical protein
MSFFGIKHHTDKPAFMFHASRRGTTHPIAIYKQPSWPLPLHWDLQARCPVFAHGAAQKQSGQEAIRALAFSS